MLTRARIAANSSFFSALLKGGPTMARALSSFVLAGALASVEAWKKKKAPPPEPESPFKPEVVAEIALVVVTVAIVLYRKHRSGSIKGDPVVQCSLVYENKEEGFGGIFDKSCMYAHWHMSDKQPLVALATFTAGTKVPERMLNHPANRVDLVKSIKSGKDVHAGWCQYMSLASKTGRARVNMKGNVPNHDVQLVAVTNDSALVKCTKGASLDLTYAKVRSISPHGPSHSTLLSSTLRHLPAQAVAAVQAASQDYNMKYDDLAHFLETGNRVGKAIDLSLGGSISGERSPVARKSSRADLGLKTPSTKAILQAKK
jgi:hypothetical protein